VTELIECYEESGVPFNIQKTFKAAQEDGKIIVILTSGKLASLSSTKGEFKVLEELIYSLVDSGHVVYRIEFEERKVERNFASYEEIESRKNRIIKSLDAIRPQKGKGLTAIGFSLGGSIFLNLLSKTDIKDRLNLDKVFLVGVTLESPLVVNFTNFDIHFIYGENDLIGLVNETTEEVIIQKPEEYAQITAGNLILMNSVKVFQRILKGQNHLLTLPQNGQLSFCNYVLSNLD